MLLRLHSLVDPAWKEALLAVDVAAVSSRQTHFLKIRSLYSLSGKCIVYSESATKFTTRLVLTTNIKAFVQYFSVSLVIWVHSLVDPAWKEALLAVDVAAVSNAFLIQCPGKCIFNSVSATKFTTELGLTRNIEAFL